MQPREAATHSNGWMCGQCGTWVPNGVTHYCSTPAQPTTLTTYAPTPQERIAAALERIAVAMEWWTTPQVRPNQIPEDDATEFVAPEVANEAVERVAQAMADKENAHRYEGGPHTSPMVEPYEYDADDFRDLVRTVANALTGGRDA